MPDIVHIDEHSRTIGVNQEITLEFLENTSAGYTWEDSLPLQVQAVRWERRTPPGQAKGAAGGPVRLLWTFRATEKGDFYLTFWHKRHWEQSSIDRKVFLLKVR